MMKHFWFQAILAGTMALCVPAAVFGQIPSSDTNRDGSLQSRLDQLEAEIRALKSAAGSDALRSQPLGHSQTNDQSAVVQTSHVMNELASHQLSAPADLFSGTEYPSVRLTGFFQADAGWSHQDAANRLALQGMNNGNIQDGADFRRARLAATGKAAENVSYMLEMDFAFPGHPSFMDVWLEVHDLAVLQNVRVGQYRNPIGMDGLTSVKELTFIERGLPFAFLPFRQIGVMTHGTNDDKDFTWALSGFRFPTDAYGGQIGDSGGYGLATRLTGLLVDNGEDGVLHVGAAYSVIDPANNAVRYRSQPEFFIAETGGAAFVPIGVPTAVPAFVDTGVIATNTANLFAAELATTAGSFHSQAEMIYAVVNRIGGSTVAFSGMSAQAAYILTGEHRPYNRKNGVLGRVVPHEPFGRDGWGAWEIAGRWSMLDLNDDDVHGGRLNDLTFGLNWYLNKLTKFQLNYIHAFLDSPVNGNSDADIVAVRAQVDF